MLSDSIPMLSYEGAGSPAAPLDARLKVIAAVLTAIAVLVAHDAFEFVAIALLVALASFGSRIKPRVLWSSIKPIFAFIVVGGGLLAVTTSGKGWNLGPGHISHSGLDLALRLSVQLFLLLAITTLITYSTSPLSIASALRRLFGFLEHLNVPVEDMTTMLTIAITFVPLMSQEVDRYLTARAARGASVRRLGLWSMLGDMLVPLIQTNLQRGDELALALDTRLYGYGRRTHRGDEQGFDRIATALVVVTVIWIVVTLTLL